MSLYEILLFVHVLAVITWVGGAIMFDVLAERAVKSDDAARVAGHLGESEHLAKTYFIPTSLITLAAGIWLVFEGDWGFTQPFVIGGLVGIVTTIVIGAGILGPTSARLAAQAASAGRLDQELKDGLAKLRNISRLDLAVLVVVIFLMTVKPGT